MAAVLETRLHQAQTEPMAPIDLLSCLVSDELERRSHRLIERRESRTGANCWGDNGAVTVMLDRLLTSWPRA